jgi:hypothetical protein
MAAALGLFVGLMLVACGGGDGSGPVVSRATSDPNLQLTPGEVKAMIPTRRELHMPLWGVMSPAERVGGAMDNRRAARNTSLWSVSREDFDWAGRLGGYVQYYWDGSCGGACLERSLESLSTEAHIFPDASAASGFLLESASHFRAGNLDQPCARVTVREFQPAAVGDEVVGFRTEVGKCDNLTGYTWRSTIFVFRLDQVVCVAEATSLNDAYPASRAWAAAQTLERQVDAVMSAA